MQFKTRPFKHQLRALELSEGQRSFAYLMDTGTGKTKVAIDDAARAYRRGEIDTLLVLAPNGVHRDWIGNPKDTGGEPEGIFKHLPDDIPRAAGFYSSGYKRNDFRDALTATDRLKVISMNIESISRGKGYELAKHIVQNNKAFFVVDEGQRFKRPGSKRTRNAWFLGGEAEYNRLLSGSVITKGYEDLYGQFRCLDWRILGFRTNAEFKARHCKMGGFENRQIKGYIDVDRLLDKIQPYIYQVLLEDCFDMPERTIVPRAVEWGEEQHHVYKTLKKKFMAELGSRQMISAAQATTRLIRLQQIMHGFIYSDEGVYKEFPAPRVDAVADILSGFAGKVIVWVRFQEDVPRLSRALKAEGITFTEYYGPVSKNQREVNLRRWREDPTMQAILATPQTLSEGRTLNEATGSIFFGRTFQYYHRKQSLGRNYRHGQDKRTIVWDLELPHSVDQRITAAHRQTLDAVKNLEDRRELITFLTDNGD